MKLPRRVVTGVRAGKSVFLADGVPPNCHVYEGWPGHMTSVLWATAPASTVPLRDGVETAPPGLRITPEAGESRLLIVRFPPDAIFADPSFNPVRLEAELAVHTDGLHQCFEPDAPGMHQTDSVDYDLVLEGEVWLELDDGAEVHLSQGDAVVQGGGRHAWHNKSERPAVMAFILNGARRAP